MTDMVDELRKLMATFGPSTGSFRIVESRYMTVPQEEIVVRSWRERLFSLPWHPMTKTKTIIVQVPYPDVIVDKVNGIIYCHPSIAAKIAADARIFNAMADASQQREE